MTLNLARRPFANLRPLRRLSIALWTVGGVATIAAVWLYALYLSGSAEKRAELRRLEESATAETGRIASLEGELQRFDLRAQNSEIAYLNDRIAERTFAWSTLFDDLAQVLPWDVRIVSLSPLSILPDRRAQQQGKSGGESFALRLTGTARDGEALLTLLDRMYGNPAFDRPDLQQERRQNGEELAFNLTVTYRPQRQAAPEQIAPTASRPAEPRLASPGGIAASAPPSPAESPQPSPTAPQPPAPPAGVVAQLPPRDEPPPAAAQPAGSGEGGGMVAAVPDADPDTPPQVAPRWAGVTAGTDSTAPAPRGRLAEPPLALVPTMSSPTGIR